MDDITGVLPSVGIGGLRRGIVGDGRDSDEVLETGTVGID